MTRGKLKSLFSLPDTLPAIFPPFSFFHFFFFLFTFAKLFFGRWCMTVASNGGTPCARTAARSLSPEVLYGLRAKADWHRHLAPRQPPPDPRDETWRAARRSSARNSSQPRLGPHPGPGTLGISFFSPWKSWTEVPLFRCSTPSLLVSWWWFAVKASKTVWRFILEFSPKNVRFKKKN